MSGFNPFDPFNQTAEHKRRTRLLANAKSKRLKKQEEAGPCYVTTYDPKSADAPVVEIVKTGFETAAYL